MKAFSFIVLLSVSFCAAFFLGRPVSLSAADTCLECHEKETPGIVNYWRESLHYKKNIGCIDCHGSDIEANHKRRITVDASTCGACHKKAFKEHILSRHAIGIKTGKGCTRKMEKTDDSQKSCLFCHKPGSFEPVTGTDCAMFLAQSPEMQKQGCSSCHMIEVRCDTCHTKHGTDLGFARDPKTCGVCHMGPDHAQFEMWELSRHGVLFSHNEKTAPSCVTCHMNKGSHNISSGITAGLPNEAKDIALREREFMINICSGCHTKILANRNLDDADKIRDQAASLVEEARKIIEDLRKEDLLLPRPADRPAHPLLGESFTTGPHMLYENLSLPESLYFRMKQFYYMSAYKGAFHQNPDYAHWYGNAPLKLALSEIKSEAALLRQINVIKKRVDNLGKGRSEDDAETEEIKRSLRDLNEKKLKGDLTEKEYELQKKRLLDDKGL